VLEESFTGFSNQFCHLRRKPSLLFQYIKYNIQGQKSCDSPVVYYIALEEFHLLSNHSCHLQEKPSTVLPVHQ
ncbi:hypothetical protein AVEN_91790-1, partial [Araneus ventricosus]